MSRGARLKAEDMDRIIKLYKGAGKAPAEIAIITDKSTDSVKRCIKMFDTARNGNVEKMIKLITDMRVGKHIVEWAYDYVGQEAPEKVLALFEPAAPAPEPVKNVEDDNVLVLIEKVNALYALANDISNRLNALEVLWA